MAGPVKKYRAGGISCALWENQAKMNGRNVVMLKATIEGRYKDKGGSWKSSNRRALNCLSRPIDAQMNC